MTLKKSVKSLNFGNTTKRNADYKKKEEEVTQKEEAHQNKARVLEKKKIYMIKENTLTTEEDLIAEVRENFKLLNHL